MTILRMLVLRTHKLVQWYSPQFTHRNGTENGGEGEMEVGRVCMTTAPSSLSTLLILLLLLLYPTWTFSTSSKLLLSSSFGLFGFGSIDRDAADLFNVVSCHTQIDYKTT